MSTSKTLFLSAACLALAAAASLPAQQEQRPVFRSGVQLVEIDVRVFDRQGQFVASLTREDFEIVEEGAPRPVETFFLVEEGENAAAARDSAVPQRNPQSPQTWIFFFDLNHLTPGAGFDRARKAVEDFVSGRFRDGDLAGVLAGDKMINNRLTSVRQELLDAVKQVKPRAESRTRWLDLTREWPRLLDEEEAVRIARNEREPLQRAIVRACSDQPDMCKMTSPDSTIREKAIRLQRDIARASLQTLSSMNTLGSGLARIPGPKTVVLLSDGFPIQDIETTARSVVGQIARAGARVYAIDVRGLGRVGGPDAGQSAAEDTAGAATRFDSNADAPNSLAVDTGGMMIRNENNIGRALQTIAADAGRFYVLGFQPDNVTWDGKFRSIQVRVKREGLRVRARRGYLAIEPSRMLVPKVPGAPATPPPPPAVETITPPPADGADAGVMRMRPDAVSRVRELAGGDPATGDSASRGWAAYQRGDVEGALGPLQDAAQQAGVRPWVLYLLGLSLAALDRPADAVASWERVRQAAPEFVPVYIDLAATYSHMSALGQALDVLRDAQQRWPKNPEIHNGIGVLHLRRGAIESAVEAFLDAIRLAPDDALGHFNLGRAYELRYARSGRWVSSQRRWTMNEADRERAIERYREYLRIGGPYSSQAQDALQRLQWLHR